MTKRITITDIAKAAGVSTATVSYYLNGHYGNMSEDVRNRLEQIVRESGYRPNNLARSLKRRDTKSIGLIVPMLYGQIAFRVVAGACRVLDEAGYTVNITLSANDIGKERRYVEQCLANQVNGLIVVPSLSYGQTNLLYLQSICESGTPVVISTRCPPSWPYDGVRLDYANSVDSLMRHFHSKGYKKVAFFLDAMEAPVIPYTKSFRREVFYACSQKYFGVDGAELVWYGIKTEANAAEAVKEFMARYPESPKAIFAVNLPTLGYTLQASRDYGAKIPDDLGIGGYGGLDWTFYTEPSLTVITQPLEKVGETAAELMLRRLREPEAPPKLELIESKLIPCASTNRIP